jgi:hypothetical protein
MSSRAEGVNAIPNIEHHSRQRLHSEPCYAVSCKETKPVSRTLKGAACGICAEPLYHMAPLRHCRLNAGLSLAGGTCMEIEAFAPRCPPDPAAIGYTLIRHIGLVLDELSAQGLEIWQDERRRWLWSWQATSLRSERGFWAIGEAVVDAVVARYPAAFDSTAVLER